MNEAELFTKAQIYGEIISSWRLSKIILDNIIPNYKTGLEKINSKIDKAVNKFYSRSLSILDAKDMRESIKDYNDKRKELESEIQEYRQSCIDKLVLCIKSTEELKELFNHSQKTKMRLTQQQDYFYNLIPQDYFLPAPKKE